MTADVDNITIFGNSFLDNTKLADNEDPAGIDFDDPDDTLIAQDNWWGDNSGPQHPRSPSGTGDIIRGDVNFSPWTQNRIPVMLIPGIMGTELWRGGDDLIWPDILGIAGDLLDAFMGVLVMDSISVPVDDQIVIKDIVRKPITGKEIFEGLIEELLSNIVGSYKAAVLKIIHQNNARQFAWQRSFHDHIIWNESEFLRIQRYIANNPAHEAGDDNKKTNGSTG